MTANRAGLAVFGMGRMGLEHIQNIIMSPRASLKWIVRSNIKEAVEFKEQYNLDVKCTTPNNIDQVLDDPGVNGVVIVSPTSTHELFLNKSLNADKAVFCEKPLTSSVASTIASYELAAVRRKPLFCAFQRRFDPSMSKVHQSVRSGEHGFVRIVKSTSRDYPFPSLDYIKSSAGIFADSTIHDLDLCSWMVGSKPSTIFAQGVTFNKKLKAAGDNEQVVVVITYENGAVTVIDNGRWSPFGHDTRIEVLCEKTLLSVGNKPVNTVYTASEEGRSEPRIEEDFLFRYREAYRNEMNHFLDIMEGKCEPLITKKDTVQAMRLTELCKESFAAQKAIPYTE